LPIDTPISTKILGTMNVDWRRAMNRDPERGGLWWAVAVLAILVCGSAQPAAAGPADGWRYVLPPPGDPFEHAPLRALPLSDTKPADVVEEVVYRGSQRHYAQLRYGSPSSVRVTVVLDEIGPYEADLYVDAGRKRRIETRDRVPGDGLTWRIPLDLALVEGANVTAAPRAVVFRFGPVGRILSFASAGYLEGSVQIAGRIHRARRIDGDGNGLLTDPQDRLWIDLDDDGRWDAAAEQFLYAPVVTVGGTRYAVRSDPLGKHLDLGPLEGTGTVRLAVHPTGRGARVTELAATLVGRDGSVYSFGGTGVPAVLPAGEYRLATVTVTLDDAPGAARWTFVFSDNGARPDPRWYTVARGGSLTIDPIGTLSLHTGLTATTVRPGRDLDFQPKLYTGDGLLIVACVRGVPGDAGGREGTCAESFLATADGGRLGSAQSGFA
jgi:hypothetical protein